MFWVYGLVFWYFNDYFKTWCTTGIATASVGDASAATPPPSAPPAHSATVVTSENEHNSSYTKEGDYPSAMPGIRLSGLDRRSMESANPMASKLHPELAAHAEVSIQSPVETHSVIIQSADVRSPKTHPYFDPSNPDASVMFVFEEMFGCHIFGRGKRVHCVSVDQQNIRVSAVKENLSKYQIREENIAYSTADMAKSVRGEASFLSVPTIAFTHHALILGRPAMSLLERLFLITQYSFFWLEIFSPVLTFLMIWCAIVCSTYVPETFPMSPNQFNSTAAAQLTQNIFALTVAAVIFFIIELYCIILRSNWKSNAISRIVIFGCIFLILALGLSAFLFSLAKDFMGSSSSSSSSSSSQYTADTPLYTSAFMCQCPPTRSPTPAPVSKPAADIYQFQCSVNQMHNADTNKFTDVCNLDCSVCGSKYYQPFVAYTVFATIFALLSLFVAYFHVTIRSVVNSTAPLYKENRFMRVIIYGKPQLGYPIKTCLSIEQAHSLDKLLNDIRSRRDASEFLYERQTYGWWNHWGWEFRNTFWNSF